MIVLKKHKPDDYTQTVKWLLDSEISNPYGLSGSINIFKHVFLLRRNPNLRIWGIFYRKLHIGNITTIYRTKRLIELQIFIGHKGLWGKKLASKSIRMLLAKKSKNVCVYVRCNITMTRFYTKLGFVVKQRVLFAHHSNNKNFVILQTFGKKNG